jgi:pimeloyl-ACP methyl ester carboxylesterase
MINVGTHALHARIVGIGGPVVVIDPGMGTRAEEWYSLQDSLATWTRVVVYDRAGYGSSDRGPLPRSSLQEVAELKSLLDTQDILGPYVMVGHSLGGLNVQVFADRNPDLVEGLVLLDPPPLAWITGEGFPELRNMADAMTAEWQGIADRGRMSGDATERAEAAFFEMMASEHREMFGESGRLAADITSFGHLPMTVIASGMPNPAFGEVAEEYQGFWVDQSRRLAEKSSEGEFVVARESSHMLHRDVPQLVLSRILAVVEAGRQPRP